MSSRLKIDDFTPTPTGGLPHLYGQIYFKMIANVQTIDLRNLGKILDM